MNLLRKMMMNPILINCLTPKIANKAVITPLNGSLAGYLINQVCSNSVKS